MNFLFEPYIFLLRHTHTHSCTCTYIYVKWYTINFLLNLYTLHPILRIPLTHSMLSVIESFLIILGIKQLYNMNIYIIVSYCLEIFISKFLVQYPKGKILPVDHNLSLFDIVALKLNPSLHITHELTLFLSIEERRINFV